MMPYMKPETEELKAWRLRALLVAFSSDDATEIPVGLRVRCAHALASGAGGIEALFAVSTHLLEGSARALAMPGLAPGLRLALAAASLAIQERRRRILHLLPEHAPSATT